MIKFLVMDVDGTLTDGKVYMGVDGETMKAFDIKDGCGIKVLLPQHGIIPIIITARNSKILKRRCEELGITEVHQGIKAKLDCLEKIISRYSIGGQFYSLGNCAYIGDDILDLQCIQPIKDAGGLAGCPADAVSSVKLASDYVSPHQAGEGAVRDYIEYIIAQNNSVIDDRLRVKLDKAVEYISKLDFHNLKVGKFDVSPDFYYSVQEYIALDAGESTYESHRKYIDIQWLYEGVERLLVTDISSMFPSDSYNEEKDIIHYYKTDNMSSMILTPGSCAILFPKDAHRPERFMDNKCIVKKVVGKLRIS